MLSVSSYAEETYPQIRKPSKDRTKRRQPQFICDFSFSIKQMEFFSNVFTECSEFSDESIYHYNVRHQDATTTPARHMWETGSFNWAQFMLHWFIRFPDFTEFDERSVPFFGKTPIYPPLGQSWTPWLSITKLKSIEFDGYCWWQCLRWFAFSFYLLQTDNRLQAKGNNKIACLHEVRFRVSNFNCRLGLIRATNVCSLLN